MALLNLEKRYLQLMKKKNQLRIYSNISAGGNTTFIVFYKT